MTDARRETLDACVLINLYATGRLGEIAVALNVRWVIAREVSEESFYLREDTEQGGGRTAVDLEHLVAEGVLEVVELEEAELTTFVEIAAEVDEGEAATIAIASQRGLPIATDDRAALRLLAAGYPDVEVLRTSELLRAFVTRAELSPLETAECIRRIESLASFFPGRHDPEYEWWHEARES